MFLSLALGLGLAVAQSTGSLVDLSLDPDKDGLSGDGSFTVVQATDWFQAPPAWTPEDEFRLTRLDAELQAVRPLINEFDGELEIMRRLQAAIEPLEALAAGIDGDLVYRALIFQGFAVHRYFQDQLASDPAAANYRTTLMDQQVVDPWAAALALDPNRIPNSEDLPEEAQRRAFDETRALLRLSAQATITVQGLPGGAAVHLDGVPNPEMGDAVLSIAPGPHFVSAWVGPEQILRARLQVEPGAAITLTPGLGPSDLASWRQMLLNSPKTELVLPPDLLAQLSALDEPIELWIPDSSDGEFRWQVVDGMAVPQRRAGRSTGGSGSSWMEPSKGVGARVSLGGGWLYDGDYYLLHVNDGAPATKGTVNAVPLMLGVSANAWSNLLTVGAGVDLFVPFGAYQTLPSGDWDVRPRAYPHVSAGVIFFQVTAGFLFPWQLGLGAVAHIPVGERLSLSLHGLYGRGLNVDRDPDPLFEASDTLSAWLTVDVRAERSKGL
jgi:hypothetical protein